MKHEPITLGDKFAPKTADKPQAPKPPSKIRRVLRNALFGMLNMALLSAIAALPLWWLMTGSDMRMNVMLMLLGILFVLWFLTNRARNKIDDPAQNLTLSKPRITNSLLVNDRQGFMRYLRLDAKTAIFDGSNIYHFGRENELDAQPLGMLAYQLRAEGYRIVCFFDANIFYTLNEHDAFPKDRQHSLDLLQDIFGLKKNEIYVVPSGTQADKYVLDSLKHLPISFAVTNDRFRDYAKQYPTVMKGNQWRKGVEIRGNEIRLFQHKLQQPIYIS